jgi:hypothetical protein
VRSKAQAQRTSGGIPCRVRFYTIFYEFNAGLIEYFNGEEAGSCPFRTAIPLGPGSNYSSDAGLNDDASTAGTYWFSYYVDCGALR